MRIIINAEPDEMEYVMGLVVKSFGTFARHQNRIGWGWSFCGPGGRSFFIRRTKGGFSASPADGTISDRGVRNLPVTISISYSMLKGADEESARAFHHMRKVLGDEIASSLFMDGQVEVQRDDSDQADALITELRSMADKQQDIMDMTISLK